MRKASLYPEDFQTLWKNLLKIFFMYETDKAGIREDWFFEAVVSVSRKIVGLERRRRTTRKQSLT